MSDMPRQQWVPYEWQHRVCNCLDPHYSKQVDDHQGNVCRDCGGYFRWVLLLCRGCDNKYLALFRHPEWCPHTARCLQCIEAGYKRDCNCGLNSPVFHDYVFDIDRQPRAVPKIEDVLELEITFDF